jgi:hypothetical protein
MSDIAKAVRKSAKIIEQFQRDSGRPVRRHLQFPDTVSSEYLSFTADAPSSIPTPAFDPQVYNTQRGPTITHRTESIRTWFSGCYTYYLDPGKTALGRLHRQEQIANKLLGIRINPETLWELQPWSWAIDWIANTGDIMTNISALSRDSLVLRWGYVMRYHRITDTYYRGKPDTFKSPGPRGPFVQSFTTVVKKRRVATPYGFGLSYDGFSNRQKAIIAALGLSRLS